MTKNGGWCARGFVPVDAPLVAMPLIKGLHLILALTLWVLLLGIDFCSQREK